MSYFDRVAPFYDILARVVFGKSIKDSQIAFLKTLKPDDRVLICGGGTGWILSELDKLNIPLQIEYVENSERMIYLTQRRLPFKNIKVKIFHEDIFNHELKSYNVIITNFFLDVFKPAQLKSLIKKLKASLNASGSWLVTDFRNTNNYWHKFLNSAMHVFFKLFSSLESGELQNFELLLKSEGLKLKEQKLFYGGFIGTYKVHL